MALDVATLGIRVDASGAITVLDEFGKKLGTAQTKSDALTGTLQKLVSVFAAYRAAEWAKETLLLGARMETLGVVMDVVGRNAGKTAAQMQQYQRSLEETGISGIGARESLAKMAGAQLDLAKSAQLARVAQDAAVIANQNSTQAFETLIEGITTGQPRVLRTLGIFVDFEAGQKKFAATLGKTSEQLSASERLQANMNTAMSGGVQIAGAYEAAMGTAGKQLNSTVRYLEDAREKASRAFQPMFTEAVFGYAKALKVAGENAEGLAGGMAALATAIGLVTVAVNSASIKSFFVMLANPEVAAAVVAIAAIATAVGSIAENAALAQRDLAENLDTLKAMSTPQLENRLKNIQKALADPATGSGDLWFRLEKQMEVILALIEDRRKAQSAADKDHKAAVDELLVKAQEELAKSEKQLAFDRTHLDMLVRMNVAKEQNNRITEEATDKAKRLLELADKLGVSIQYTAQGMMTVARVSAGINLGIQGGLAMPKVGTNAEFEQRFGVSTIGNKRVGTGESYTAPVPQSQATSWWKQFAKDREEIEANFLRGLQDSFARTFENIFTHGIRGFKDLFASFGTLVAQAVAQLASSGLTTWISGKMGSFNGGMLGAGILGATVAVVAGFHSAASAADAAAKALTRQQDALTASLTGAAKNDPTRSSTDAILSLLLQSKGIRVGTRADWDAQDLMGKRNQLAYFRDNQLNMYGGTAENVVALNKAIEQLDILIKQSEAAIRKEAEARAFEQKMLESDLRARELRALGFNDEADALALFNQQVREFGDAVKAGWSPEMLAYLAQVQELERNQAAAAKTAQAAADAQKALAEAQQQAAEASERAAERIAAAEQRAAEYTIRMADATEDLGVRLLRAQGQAEQADKRAFELQQAREIRAAQNEAMQYYRDAQKIKPAYGPGTQIGDTYYPGQFNYGSVAEYLAAQAEKQYLLDMYKQAMDYLAKLKDVQAAEAGAYGRSAGLPGASAAVPGTAGSFGTIVSRATAAQGDRMVDELTTARVLAQKYWPYLKVIADKLTGGVNTLLGNELASAQTLSGSALVT